MCSFVPFQYSIITEGVFHLPKDSGKFRKLQWEMFIGEERVPFDTLVPFIPRLPSPSDQTTWNLPKLFRYLIKHLFLCSLASKHVLVLSPSCDKQPNIFVQPSFKVVTWTSWQGIIWNSCCERMNDRRSYMTLFIYIYKILFFDEYYLPFAGLLAYMAQLWCSNVSKSGASPWHTEHS